MCRVPNTQIPHDDDTTMPSRDNGNDNDNDDGSLSARIAIELNAKSISGAELPSDVVKVMHTDVFSDTPVLTTEVVENLITLGIQTALTTITPMLDDETNDKVKDVKFTGISRVDVIYSINQTIN